MRQINTMKSEKIRLKLSYIFFGFCLVPIGPSFITDLGLNSEQIVIVVLMVLAFFIILIKGLGSIRVNQTLMILIILALILCLALVMVTDVASSMFLRMGLNIALAYFFIQGFILQLKNTNLSLEFSFCVSVILMLFLYWYLNVIPDGVVLTKLYLRDNFGLNINAFLNLFNLALIFLICLIFFPYDADYRNVKVDSRLKKALSLIAFIILITSLLQQSRQNFLVSSLLLAFLEKKYLKYLIWILVPIIAIYFEELKSIVNFFEYFSRAVIEVSSQTETTRLVWLKDAILAFNGMPNLSFEHPYDNTFLTLMISGGFLISPFLIVILTSLIFIGSRSLLVALAFGLLLNLNDQHLEFSFWLIVIFMNYELIKRLVIGSRFINYYN